MKGFLKFVSLHRKKIMYNSYETSVDTTPACVTVGSSGEETILKFNTNDGSVTTIMMNGTSTKQLIRLLEAALSDEDYDSL